MHSFYGWYASRDFRRCSIHRTGFPELSGTHLLLRESGKPHPVQWNVELIDPDRCIPTPRPPEVANSYDFLLAAGMVSVFFFRATLGARRFPRTGFLWGFAGGNGVTINLESVSSPGSRGWCLQMVVRKY